MLLLDASVWVAAKDGADAYCEAARTLTLSPKIPVAALDLTLYEVANAIGVRRARAAEAAAVCRLIGKRCTGGLVAVDADLISAALEVSSAHGLTAYDAAYVAVAERTGWSLVSTDIADLVSRGLAVTPDAAVYP